MIIDLDDLSSWPKVILDDLESRIDEIIKELDADHKFHMSADKWIKSPPLKPNYAAAIKHINNEVADKRLRVFHATRLISPEDIFKNGLKALSISERIKSLEGLSANGPLSKFKNEIPNLINFSDRDFIECRKGQVWFTPLRRFLHDGGCDIFFEHWGGEVIQRLASMHSEELEAAIKEYGSPYVVIANIPCFGWCEFADLRLAKTMIDVFIEHVDQEHTIGAWDVMIKRDIPNDCIEDILAPENTKLKSPIK